MDTKNKNKYNKKLKYMQHHELKKIKYPTGFVTGIAVATTIIARIFKKAYPSFLVSFYVTTMVLFSFYTFFIKPAIYKGNIVAYYRRSYSPRLRRFINYYRILVNFAVVSVAYCVVYTVFFLKAITLDYVPIQIDDMVELLQGNKVLYILKQSFDFKGVLTAVIVSLLLLYYMFFEDKYITIANYSNGVVYRMKELGMYFESAVKDLLETVDKEHDVKAFKDIYYDFGDGKHEPKNTNRADIADTKKESKDSEPIRRRARKNNEEV